MKKKILIILITITPISLFGYFLCARFTCDPSISYAMGKQREAINSRLNDLKNTIHSLKVETDRQTLYLTKESTELMRLRARVKIELYLLMKNNHFTENR